MEGWRQERLGSRAGTHREKEKNKNILTGKEKKKNILDTHRPSHGRSSVVVAKCGRKAVLPVRGCQRWVIVRQSDDCETD
jgi:hypothetical protein